MGGLTNLWVTVLAPTPLNRDKITRIVFPRDIENIPDNCCDGMINLRSVGLPPGLTRIGNSAFEGASFVMEDHWPPKLTSIGRYATGTVKFPGKAVILPEGDLDFESYSIGSIANEIIDISGAESIKGVITNRDDSVLAVVINRETPPRIIPACHWAHTGTYSGNVSDILYRRMGWAFPDHLESDTPCEIHTAISQFPDYTFSIYVPDKSLEVYRNTPGWKTFHNGAAACVNKPQAYPPPDIDEPVYQDMFKPLSALPEEYRAALREAGGNY
jgi:hypothetical protein